MSFGIYGSFVLRYGVIGSAAKNTLQTVAFMVSVASGPTVNNGSKHNNLVTRREGFEGRHILVAKRRAFLMGPY